MVAALLTVARFCAQRSELGVAEHWYDPTALDELLGVDTALVNDARLYRALDQLGQHKDRALLASRGSATGSGLACAASFCSTR